MEVACNNCGWRGLEAELEVVAYDSLCPRCHKSDYLIDIS